MNKNRSSAFWGAAFLMATSAIGPGFLTQTTVFTQQLAASFGFVIAVSILLDIGVQLNIWRIINVSNKPAQQIAGGLLPGLGGLLSALIVLGGLAFNIGNIAGAGMGLEVITGMDTHYGALISAILVVFLIFRKDATAAIDRSVKWLGVLMILLTCYVAFVSKPPVLTALYRTVWPEKFDYLSILTVVGGTVGGYISFAGAHRLLEAGLPEENKIKLVSRAAVRGILTASTMRIILFLAALGIVSKGIIPDAANPAADVFRQAAGEPGFRLFGIVMWSAAITSVIGSAYTSISFLRSYHPWILKNQAWVVTAFVTLSTIIFLLVGRPVQLLVWAGLINGLVLPVSLFILLIAIYRQPPNGYQHPKWLGFSGTLIALVLAFMALQVMLQ